eukprot:SAG31_NODE_26453_length_442_cov_0.650146_1_plen_77_part_10
MTQYLHACLSPGSTANTAPFSAASATAAERWAVRVPLMLLDLLKDAMVTVVDGDTERARRLLDLAGKVPERNRLLQL